MLNVVLDTNIFLSAFIYQGMTKIITDLILENKIALYISAKLKAEILRKFKEFGADKETVVNLQLFLHERGILVSPKIKISVCRDPNDNFLLELAETAKADYIITRDKDLLELPHAAWKDTKIIKPEEFLPFLRSANILN